MLKVVEQLRNSTEPDYVVLGGGNAKLLKKLPPETQLGDNANAFRGGFLLWDSRSDQKHGSQRGRLVAL